MTPYDDDEGRPRRELTEYLEVPLRYPRHFWIPYLVIFSLACVGMVLAPHKFRSATLILVVPHKVPDHFVTPMAAEGIGARLATIRQVILSRTRLEQVVEKLDPYPQFKDTPRHVVVDGMRRAIEIRVQGTDSFSIEYVNTDPMKAMLVTNMLAEQFIEDARYLRDNLTEKAYSFIQENLDEARRALEVREEALRRHKQKYWGALPEQLDTNLRILGQAQIEQATLVESLRTLEERRSGIERSMVEGRAASAAAGLPPSASATELSRLRASLAAVRSRYTDEHPDVQVLQSRIDKLEKRVADGVPDAAMDPEARQVQQSLELVEEEIRSLHARRAKLDQRVAELQAHIEQTPKAEQELLSITRDYQQLRENYTVMLRKDLEADMARKLEEHWKGGYFRILDPAHIPQRPIRPYASLFLLGGYVFGVLGGLAAAFAADFLDRSMKTQRDVEATLPSFPVLASIPYVRP